MKQSRHDSVGFAHFPQVLGHSHSASGRLQPPSIACMAAQLLMALGSLSRLSSALLLRTARSEKSMILSYVSRIPFATRSPGASSQDDVEGPNGAEQEQAWPGLQPSHFEATGCAGRQFTKSWWLLEKRADPPLRSAWQHARAGE